MKLEPAMLFVPERRGMTKAFFPPLPAAFTGSGSGSGAEAAAGVGVEAFGGSAALSLSWK
ncbi:MAG: hypothetical protein M0D55_14885 [Elusimicrobiota bacterium]|nr:MAG: hypothetical protein M0D55_14885 [Elusimicrobiota bacterium]